MVNNCELFQWLDDENGGKSVLQHSTTHDDFFTKMHHKNSDSSTFNDFKAILPLLFRTRGKFRHLFLLNVGDSQNDVEYSKEN